MASASRDVESSSRHNEREAAIQSARDLAAAEARSRTLESMGDWFRDAQERIDHERAKLDKATKKARRTAFIMAFIIAPVGAYFSWLAIVGAVSNAAIDQLKQTQQKTTTDLEQLRAAQARFDDEIEKAKEFRTQTQGELKKLTALGEEMAQLRTNMEAIRKRMRLDEPAFDYLNKPVQSPANDGRGLLDSKK